MSKTVMLLPFRTMILEAAAASSRAFSAPSFLLALTSSLISMPLSARNPCDRVQLVQPLRW